VCVIDRKNRWGFGKIAGTAAMVLLGQRTCTGIDSTSTSINMGIDRHRHSIVIGIDKSTWKGHVPLITRILCTRPGYDTKPLLHTFLFTRPLKRSKLLLSLCNSHTFPVALSCQSTSAALNKPQSVVIPSILALAPPSSSSVTI
jgi:hypothetical protein